jgi:hypothetical protein
MSTNYFLIYDEQFIYIISMSGVNLETENVYLNNYIP